MISFVLTLGVVLTIWSMCSLAEAALYAVRTPYVRQLVKDGHAAGKLLAEFKDNMERPISAVLIVNTIASAAGAAFVGAQASALFGESRLWIFSAVFTVAALFMAEIAPKVFGVAYNRRAATLLARPLSLLIRTLAPIIWVVEVATRAIKPSTPALIAPEAEVQTLAEISAEEGSIMPYEADLVRHVLDLDKVTAEEIMTPATVVKKLPQHLTLGEVANMNLEWNFSRIPVVDSDDANYWTGFVLSRDVLAGIGQDRFGIKLNELAQPLFYVPADAPGHKLLRSFLQRRTHIFGVLSEEKKIVGIVTLEDVLESLIGEEIVDELDTVVDMQKIGVGER